MEERKERLQKVIAQSGLTSRRKAEKLITEGRVQVNGKTVTQLGVKVSPNDLIVVDGVPIEKEPRAYYALYKPEGYISSVSDDLGRKTVIDLLKGVQERVYPIGRLDYNTSGLLLLTNDGKFANLLMHPRHEIEKVYLAKVKGIPEKRTLYKLITGVEDNEEILKAVRFKVVSSNKRKNYTRIRLTLHEGKNRHVRRMMERLGHPVLQLKRERYGTIDLKGLSPGQYRRLSRFEVQELRRLARKKVKSLK